MKIKDPLLKGFRPKLTHRKSNSLIKSKYQIKFLPPNIILSHLPLKNTRAIPKILKFYFMVDGSSKNYPLNIGNWWNPKTLIPVSFVLTTIPIKYILKEIKRKNQINGKTVDTN